MEKEHGIQALTLSNDSIEQEMARLFRWLAGVMAGDDPAADWPELTPELLPSRIECLLTAISTQLAQTAGRQRWQHEAERVRLLETAPGGAPVPPYGSWWLERCLQGRTTAAVAEVYRRQGITHGSGPADYLPAELELVQLLLRHQLAARLTGQNDLAEHAGRSEHDFLEALVLPWVPRFCGAGRRESDTPFWRCLFDLLELTLSCEHRRITTMITTTMITV